MSAIARDGAPALWGYGLFGGLLAMAGLPIYIHAPKFYVDEYTVSLAALGTVLFVLRGLDFVQDPALGWLAARLRRTRAQAVAIAGMLMVLAMLALFAIPPAFAPILWFALSLTVLFSAYSFLTICFYATGTARGAELGAGGHVRLAGWRETGALLGVCVAAAAPVTLAGVLAQPFAGFALGFVGVAALALWVMRAEWTRYAAPVADAATPRLRDIVADATARRLLLIALVNALPVAITSTLFLFYAETVLQAAGWEGPLLILLFLSAAATAPLWARLAQQFGARRVLMAGMGLAACSFVFVLMLGPGDIALFALICVVSGAGIGADLTLLPALFARRMAELSPEAAQGFGLWAFVTKATLALAALIVFPALDLAGFSAGGANPDSAILALMLLYAALPSVLKLLALVLLARTPLTENRA
ncbi:MFS transporter [Roseinatronobacter alkalisoli]|uniref:MFS transporter n=1 Tax=Roseinatronobacter alkalisoli TaxID=3028235 RepID=A0ABT5T8E1_9RHOB|nr:MFS transporter [Roseinatronobacter sp. HJB301]MDD7971392.1 MFS transporter [Roseinatronobacter sp. HJB301]